MKKRLSKLALLAVAAAVVLAGFPACGDDDDEDPPQPATATLTSEDIPEGGLALTAGETKDVTATLTVTNTTFSTAVKDLNENADISEFITVTAGDKVTAEAKLAEKVVDNAMKITLTVTADADAETGSTGEIKVTLGAAATTAYKTLDASEAISYTVKQKETPQNPSVEKDPTAELTGDGVNLTSGEAGTATATVTLTEGTFAETITEESFAVKADEGVTVTVTEATRTSDTEATLTLSLTAAANAANGTVSVTIKADAVKDYDEDIDATGTIGYTVSEPGEMTAALVCQIGELTAGETKTTTATVTLTNGTFATEIKAADFTATAGDKVTATVTKAERKSATEATLTLSLTAAEGAQNGTVSVTVKADALTNAKNPVTTPTVSYTVKQQPKPEDAVATLAGTAVELTAGETKEAAATVTLTKGALSDAVKALSAGADISEYLTLTAGDKATVTAKLAEKTTDTTMKITLTLTAGNEAGEGTITATLKAAAVTANKEAKAAGAIAYTVKEKQTPPNPPVEGKDPTATLAGEAITVTAGGDAETATATVTLTDGTFATTIAATNFAAKAGDNVTVTVTGAARTSDTVATLTLSVKAADGATAGNGAISVTVNAGAVKDYDKAVAAGGNIAYTVKEAEKPEDPVYFTSFVASEDLDKTADSNDYEALTSKDGLVTMDRSKYQNNIYTTIDYDEGTGTGYAYTARVKVNKSNASTNKGALTITHVKIGDILRFDGGNSADKGDPRKMSISGADETTWEAGFKTFGSFYLTAKADTIVLTSQDGEFSIYGIHVVDKKVAETAVGDPVLAYENPVLELSATSIAQGGEVTITAAIPEATKTTTYSTGRVASEKVPVTADITYDGATVTDGTVDTSNQGTLTITASYTVGEETYTSEAATLDVTKSFEPKTAEVANNKDTLGLVATGTPTSADESIAKVAISGENIVITSAKMGATTITVSDGTKTAKIDVTVKADGEIETKVHKYSPQWFGTYDVTAHTKADDGADLTAGVSGTKVVTLKDSNTGSLQAFNFVFTASRKLATDKGMQLKGDQETVSFTTSSKSNIVIKIRCGNDGRKWKVTGPNDFTTGELERKTAVAIGDNKGFTTSFDSKTNFQTITIPNADSGDWSIVKVGADEAHLNSIEIATATE